MNTIHKIHKTSTTYIYTHIKCWKLLISYCRYCVYVKANMERSLCRFGGNLSPTKSIKGDQDSLIFEASLS